MVFSILPQSSFAQTVQYVDLEMVVTGDDGGDHIIKKGEKGVAYTLRSINMTFDESFRRVGSNIEVYANGVRETDKFEINVVNGAISLTLRNAPAAWDPATHLKPLQLRKHTLYNVYIPQGTFRTVDGLKQNKGINYTFVTNTDEPEQHYTKDILKKVTPVHGAERISENTNQLVFEFVDNIWYTDFSRIKEYISISSEPLHANIPGYKIAPSYDGSDSIDHFNISIAGNKLILTPKAGKLKDFAQYTVRLKNRAVFLSRFSDANARIYNISEEASSDWETVVFTTDQMVKSTYPLNNSENIPVEPTIWFDFKYPVEILDKSKIRLIADDAQPMAIAPEDIFLSTSPGEENRVLKIRVNDDEAQGKYPLRRNTLYKVELEAGALRFIDYPIYNQDMHIFFITAGEGDHPRPLRYVSNVNASDDITSIEKTNLAPDGSIFVQFNRPIQLDKEQVDLSPVGGTKLYKLPPSNKKRYSAEGRLFDEEYHYSKMISTLLPGAAVGEVIDIDYDEVGNGRRYNLLDPDFLKEYELSIAKVEVVEPDKIKITPKFPLDPLNQYRITLDKRLIEDKHNYNLRENIDFTFWTKASAVSIKPSWDLSILAEKMKTPYTADENLPKRSYQLYGTPAYDQTTPLVFNITQEVIPAAKEQSIEKKGSVHYIKNKALEKIILYGTYYDSDVKITSTTSDIVLSLGKSMQAILEEGLSPDAQQIKWTSKDPEIAVVDQKGKIQGISRGETTIYVYTEKDNQITEITSFKVTVQEQLQIEHFKLQYYYENNVKKTRISLYPNEKLQNGKTYRLYVPYDVFQSRSGDTLSNDLEVVFTVQGDRAASVEIEKVESSVLSIGDLMSKEEASFMLYGYNFSEDIASIQLTNRLDPLKVLTIPAKDIDFLGVDKIRVNLRGTVKEEFAKEANVGRYSIRIVFKNTRNFIQNDIFLELISMGSPQWVTRVPERGGSYDERSLLHPVRDAFTQDRYFIKVTFKDPDGKLAINGTTGLANIMSSSVNTLGSAVSLIDTSFISQIMNRPSFDQQSYINKYLLVKRPQNKEADLYIPILLLRSQTDYYVKLNSGILRNNVGVNDEITWAFTTTAIPYIKDVLIGTVVEDYDVTEPIVLVGDFFKSGNVRVYFNTVEAHSVSVREIKNSSGDVTERQLYVYLPRGRSKLEPGLYNITIENDSNHTTIEYGKLSVVRKGEYIPNEQYKVKNEDRKGQVQGKISVSEDTILLESRYTDSSKVELDLDDLMGEATLVRKVQYRGSSGDSIGELITTSKWANITLYGVRWDSSVSERTLSVHLGRVEPTVAQNLKARLKGRNIKSEIIQVSGENYTLTGVYLEIPYTNSNGNKIKVLRYDENTRTFYEESITVDKNNNRVKVRGLNKGIFVVVE